MELQHPMLIAAARDIGLDAAAFERGSGRRRVPGGGARAGGDRLARPHPVDADVLHRRHPVEDAPDALADPLARARRRAQPLHARVRAARRARRQSSPPPNRHNRPARRGLQSFRPTMRQLRARPARPDAGGAGRLHRDDRAVMGPEAWSRPRPSGGGAGRLPASTGRVFGLSVLMGDALGEWDRAKLQHAAENCPVARTLTGENALRDARVAGFVSTPRRAPVIVTAPAARGGRAGRRSSPRRPRRPRA